jgi:hypothetical protein
MTNIQMILALGAMILLTIVITNVNKNSLYTEDVMYNSNFGIAATSIASSFIEDASKKRYDNVFYSGDSIVTAVSTFTADSDFGTDTGEDPNDVKTFNDFDDYDGYQGFESSIADFNFSCEVNYVNIANPDQAITSKSWHKKITVKVWSVSMQDTIVMSSIYSYWTDFGFN